MCVAKAMKSEEKSQKRAAELSGNELEEALSILSESALLQRPIPCIEPPSSSMKPCARILRRRKTSSSTKLPRVRAPAQTVHPCQSDCSLGLGPDRSECRECKAAQARPTEAEQVAEQQKGAADLLTKHRTTPDLLRKSLYGKRSMQPDKETAAVTQLEANQAQVTNIGEACTTTGRAPAVL